MISHSHNNLDSVIIIIRCYKLTYDVDDDRYDGDYFRSLFLQYMNNSNNLWYLVKFFNVCTYIKVYTYMHMKVYK